MFVFISVPCTADVFVFNLIALETTSRGHQRHGLDAHIFFVVQLKAIKFGYGTIHQTNVITNPLDGIGSIINVCI
jgi:hypothetical protein